MSFFLLNYIPLAVVPWLQRAFAFAVFALRHFPLCFHSPNLHSPRHPSSDALLPQGRLRWRLQRVAPGVSTLGRARLRPDLHRCFWAMGAPAPSMMDQRRLHARGRCDRRLQRVPHVRHLCGILCNHPDY